MAAACSNNTSGDYNPYGETDTVTTGNLQVTVRGDNGMISVAVWTDGGYAYAVEMQDAPMTSETVGQLIAGIR